MKTYLSPQTDLENKITKPEYWENLPSKQGFGYYWKKFLRRAGLKNIYQIIDGTLIDHIEVGKSLEIIKVLGLDRYQDTNWICAAVDSRKYGRKEVIGIADKEFTLEELNKLAIVTRERLPTVNIIRKGRVVKKGRIILPDILENLVQCPYGCITTVENEDVPTKFRVISRDPLKLQCIDNCVT